jgi:hypothetical protein
MTKSKVSSLESRVVAYFEGDPSLVLADDAPQEAKDHDDLQVAAVMFSHVLRADPESVPERLREHISNARHLDFQDNVGVPRLGTILCSNAVPVVK